MSNTFAGPHLVMWAEIGYYKHSDCLGNFIFYYCINPLSKC